MAREFTIPQLIRAVAINGYQLGGAQAVNRLLTAENEIEYEIAKREATKEITGYDNFEILESDELGSSPRAHFEGVPIWMPVELRTKDRSLEDLLLDTAIVSIQQARNIVKTPIQGRDGTVKEYISDGDYQISVNGILASNSLRYPKSYVVELVEFMKLKQSIEVVSPLLNTIGVYELVVEDWSLPHTEYVNCQSYSFSAVSEKPIELIL